MLSRRSAVVVAAVVTASLAGLSPAHAIGAGEWTAAAPMTSARASHTATLLQDGSVLVGGGNGHVAAAELYDPSTGTWSPAGSMAAARADATASLLADGRVLVAGGDNGTSAYLSSAELYDPATNTWSSAGSMSTPRIEGTATTLADGRVLVVGGNTNPGVVSNVDLYDPTTNTWSAGPAYPHVVENQSATLLNDGRVLVAGGNDNGNTTYSDAYLYDPSTNTWSAAASMAYARKNQTATLLADGRVLLTAGIATIGPAPPVGEVYDPAADTWTPTGPMSFRILHTATLLPSGGVLVAGGYDSSFSSTATTVIYDPTSNQWTAGPPMTVARSYHTATLLPDGSVLVAGGQAPLDETTSTEIYQPPPPGFVESDGTQLSVDGKPYRPIGINIYNANSNGLCSYAMDGSVLDDSLTAIGDGPNVIRAWFFQPLATTNGVRDWTAFDHTLAVAKAHGYRVIATLADQWGDCGASPGTGYGYKDEAWYQTGYTQPDSAGTVSYRDWVAEVVSRYKDDPTILAWQLMNEPEVLPSQGADCSTVPESTAETVLSGFAGDVSGLIKSIDPNHLVSLGTIGGGQCGTQGSDYQQVLSLPNLDLCEYHDYDPTSLIPGDQFNGLQTRIDQCNALDKPLIVGELGIVPDQVGGTLADRAELVASKLCAQLTAGVAGELLWAWHKDASTLDNFDIGPGDPALDAIRPWADPAFTCSAPDPPTGLVAAAGDQTASVSWIPPAGDGGSPVSSYTVTASPGGQTVTVPSTSPSLSAFFTGLTNGASYTFTTTASNAAGTGDPSAPSAAVVPTAGSPTPVTVAAPVSPDAPTTVSTGSDPAQTSGVTTSVTVPAGSDTSSTDSVSVTQAATTESAPSGYAFGPVQVNISAPNASSASSPLVLSFTFAPGDGQNAGDTVIYRTEADGTPEPLPPCTSSATASPDPCATKAVSVVIGGVTYLQASALTTQASEWNEASPAPVAIGVSDTGYSRRSASDALGGRVGWKFTGAHAHSVTDAIGLGPADAPLFTSGAKSAGTFRYAFWAAGSYEYRSSVHGDSTPGFHGAIVVPDRVAPALGSATSTYSVTWATKGRAGYTFDVQYRYKPAGSKTWGGWTGWKTAVRSASSRFSPTGSRGSYQFRSRLLNSSTGRATGWSPAARITVS